MFFRYRFMSLAMCGILVFLPSRARAVEGVDLLSPVNPFAVALISGVIGCGVAMVYNFLCSGQRGSGQEQNAVIGERVKKMEVLPPRQERHDEREAKAEQRHEKSMARARMLAREREAREDRRHKEGMARDQEESDRLNERVADNVLAILKGEKEEPK